MLITEVLPKAQFNAIPPARFPIHGYKTYFGFTPDDPSLSIKMPRGICIYVRDFLPCSEVKFPESPFHEHLWMKIHLRGHDTLLIGCIYRSPSSLQDYTYQLNQLLSLVTSSRPLHLLITGDFNAPEIDWTAQVSRAPNGHWSHDFLELLRDHYLTCVNSNEILVRPDATHPGPCADK